MDIDEQMVMLSCYLKYVIEWRRNAKIKAQAGYGSFQIRPQRGCFGTCSKYEPKGNWDNRPDD
jgi:hypothetical protein